MTYSRIRPCAFVPSSDTPLAAEFSALAFPAQWRAILLDLYRHGRRNPDKIRSVPTRRFRQLLHAVAPELIALSREASPDDADPILYCARPFPPAVMRALVAAWAADLPRGDDAAGPVRDALIQLGAGDLQWAQATVDLLEQSVTAGGTAEPARSSRAGVLATAHLRAEERHAHLAFLVLPADLAADRAVRRAAPDPPARRGPAVGEPPERLHSPGRQRVGLPGRPRALDRRRPGTQ